MTKLFLIKGAIQNYAWGGSQFIPNLLGVEPSNDKCAEYWLGAHSKSPSTLKTPEDEITLDHYISKNASKVLGSEVNKAFGRLPFLFKVLDVKDMLSIQVHPSKKEAEKGFALENEKGISLDAPFRNYKDDNHKPEVMVALSEFWLLHGFLPKEKLIAVLNNVPEFSNLISIFNEGGYRGLYKHVMEQSQDVCNQNLKPLIDRILPLYKSGKLEKSSSDYWAAKSIELSDDKTVLDKGIYSIYFFNIVKANKGEAIFQDAGVPHAYLEGQNMELMANSDNVLRGGLTPKHIDVPELLKHVVFEETIPNILLGNLQNDGLERIYKTPAPDFELSQINISKSDKYQSLTNTSQILIVIEGEAIITESSTTLSVGKGESVFLSAESSYQITSSTSTTIFKATVP